MVGWVKFYPNRTTLFKFRHVGLNNRFSKEKPERNIYEQL